MLNFYLYVVCLSWSYLSLANFNLPDEYQSSGGHSLAFDNAGSVAHADLGSLDLNPAMLAISERYDVGFSFHLPSAGRSYIQAGALDSKTSKLAAGISVSRFIEPYESPYLQDLGVENGYDAPIKQRLRIGVAQVVSNLAIGVSGQYLEFYDPFHTPGEGLLPERFEKGVVATFGLVGLLTKHLRFGGTFQNIGTKKTLDYAPPTIRVGLAYLMLNGLMTSHLDLIDRRRVYFETRDHELSDHERRLTLSTSVTVYDFIRILAGMSQDLQSQNQSLALGVAITNTFYSFSYSIQNPSLGSSRSLHQSLHLAIQIAV